MQKFRELSEAIKISLETPEIKEKIEKLKNDYLLEEEKIYNSMMYMDNCYDFFVNAGNDYEFMIEEITIYNEELESMNKEINKPEVAEEKKENEKQEKTVVELESPKEKSKLDINEIDLAGIKILNGTKIFEVEAGYNQYLQKTLYSTFQVVLPLSNYEAHLRGLTLDEIDALKNSFADQFTVKQKLSETIYNCIEQTSIGKISYQDFLQYTVDTDFEILVYAVYNKTYGKINSFTITCPHCGVSHKREIPFNEIIQKVYEELRNHEVVIVTARDSYEIPYIQAFLKHHKIPIKKIFCTDNGPKLETLQMLKSIRHYDDSLRVKKELEGSGIEFIQTYP
jgi:hypothetical protein